jgi:hypothetical protein
LDTDSQGLPFCVWQKGTHAVSDKRRLIRVLMHC